MNRKLERFARIGLAAAAMFVLSAENSMAFAAEAVQETVTCEEFFQKISVLPVSDLSKDVDMHPRHIEDKLKECGTGDSKIALVLEQIFIYRPAMGNRDHPNPMSHLPDYDVAAARNNDIREINDVLKKLKSMDKNDVEQVLRFMAVQSVDSYEFSRPAFEIAARLYPKEYDSFESLTQPGTKARDAWETAKSRWITGEEK
jgi:hypothetical protein